MRGLIILDGPDGAGKTTLAKRIIERHGGTYLHLTYRWKNNMFEYHTAALHHAISKCEKELVIIDRLWMSEVIYSTVYRGKSQWPHMGRMMDRVIRKHAGMYVMCFAESMKFHNDMFMKLKTERVEMYNDTADVWALYYTLYHGGLTQSEYGIDYFEDLAQGPGMKARGDVWKYSIDNEGRDMDGYIDRLMTCLVLRKGEQYKDALVGGYHNVLGYAPEAKYLFVGDKLSPARYNHVAWPFYAYKNSSLFLCEQLSIMGFDETEACWTNINEPDGADVVEIMTSYYKLDVIYFGREALLGLRDYNFSARPFRIEGTSHPAWHKRFKAKEDGLAEEIKEAINQLKQHPRKHA